MTNPFLSPKELAQAIGVSESSLKRWADDGKLVVTRTAGGHRRIALQEAVRFVRAGGHRLRDAAVLGLEAAVAAGSDDDLNERLLGALQDGDALACRALMVGAFLRGRSLASLCDGPLRSAMDAIGALWRRSDSLEGIAVEHLATGIAQQLLAQCRMLLSDPAPSAPLALGGCLEGDAHVLPSAMAATTLTECGWRALDLGPCTAIGVLKAAISRHRPALVWRAISVVNDAPTVVRELRTLAGELGRIPLVVGGADAAALTLGGIANLHQVGSMAELASFACGVACTARRRAR
jgi:excisionase family DNA binding protein